MNAFLAQRASDEALSRKLAAGDATAFDELYRRYAGRLGVYGARLVGDRARGEDVAQIALMNAYQAIARGSEPERVRPWLYRIAQNAALELLSRPGELAELDLGERAAAPDEPHAARGELLAALRALPDRQRRAYVLRELRGLRVREIADRLELEPQQVEQALFAARNRLAEVLTFGEALDCETVRALDGGRLDRIERRALRRHLRACEECRGAVAVGGHKLGAAPWGLLSVLRQYATGLFGGATATVAKVGVVVFGAAIVGGVPVAAKAIGHSHDHGAPARLVAVAAGTVGTKATPATLLGAFGNTQFLVAHPFRSLFSAPSLRLPLAAAVTTGLVRASARPAGASTAAIRISDPTPVELQPPDGSSGDSSGSSETASPPPPDTTSPPPDTASPPPPDATSPPPESTSPPPDTTSPPPDATSPPPDTSTDPTATDPTATP